MTEHMQDYLALLKEMISVKTQNLNKLRWTRSIGKQQLREQIAILEEKKIEVESFIKSGPKNHGEKTQ
ncbi:hypothetical protein GCM10023338_12310 [Wohlfahrtiimonas larvae]|uniref:Uncharacterized protein n=1 Tax=Wohlfahrtiimonas larvae TaxID=1157986 RepID=A0ABP9MN26_9GAMM